MDTNGVSKAADGFVFDRATDSFTELYWVNGVWKLHDGTVYRQVPLYDPTNIKDEK